MKLLPYDDRRGYFIISIPLLALLIALAFGAILMLFIGVNPWQAYIYMSNHVFGDLYVIGEVLSHFVPLLFCGLGFSLAYKAGFFNVGLEGQLYMGALGALLAGTLITNLPAIIHIPLALLMGFIFGALWCLVAGILKIWFGSDEIINTIMLNYIAILLIEFMLKTFLKEPQSLLYQSNRIAESATLPHILPGTKLHLGFILALLAAYGVYYLIKKTPYGYKMRMVGKNQKAASYARINIVAATAAAVIISGGLAGIGGAAELMGRQFRLVKGFSPGFGFESIGVAVMGRHKPLGIVLTSLLFAVIREGAGALQRGMGIPLPMLWIIQGVIMIMIVASQYLVRKYSADMIGGRA